MTTTRPSTAGLVSRTRPLSEHGAGGADLLDALGPDGAVWLHDGGGMVTSGVAARIAVGPGPDRFGRAAGEVAELLGSIETDDPLGLPGTGPLAIGALPFHARAGGELVVPAVVVGRTPDGQAWITEIGPDERGTTDRLVTGLGATPSPMAVTRADGRRRPETGPGPGDRGDEGRRAWTTAVHDAVDRITSGPLAKVVLARQVVVDGDCDFDRRLVVDRLRGGDPGGFTYAVGGFVGASPELLARRRGDRVVSQPMAGSAARGTTPAEDDRIVAELAASPKEAAEHALVVGAVRDALAPVCAELSAEARPHAVRLATVTHLATTVTGRLREPAPTALDLVARLHPTPAVGGLPRADALAAIAELEDFDRGLYAGPVGWVDSRGDGDWAVALRCARLDGTRAELVAGAGIMADSDADAEWAETEAKLEPMLRALGA